MTQGGGVTLNPEGGSGCVTGMSREVGGLTDAARDGTLTLAETMQEGHRKRTSAFEVRGALGNGTVAKTSKASRRAVTPTIGAKAGLNFTAGPMACGQ